MESKSVKVSGYVTRKEKFPGGGYVAHMYPVIDVDGSLYWNKSVEFADFDNKEPNAFALVRLDCDSKYKVYCVDLHE